MEPTLSLSSAPKLSRPRRPERAPFYAVLHQFFDRFTREYEQRFERTFGPLRGIVPKTVERFFGCGLPEGGFARIRCDVCGNEYLVAFSCKQRGFCPSCSAKRAALWVEFVRERVIRPVPHRHFVFALPNKERMISSELVERMRTWQHSGFHAYAGEEISDGERPPEAPAGGVAWRDG